MPKALPLIDATAPVCCAPVAAAPMDDESTVQVAVRLKALADPARLRLLSIVLASGNDGACVCDLTAPVALSQPTVSHHLKVLLEAGLVEREQRGSWAYFRVLPEPLAALRGLLA